MAKEYKVGDEPVPGYRLAKFIGRGGFGEVWRAVGPGGTEVALKSIALDRKQGMKEFRSLRLVKRIHHPNLVPILAFWLIDTDGHPLDDESIDLLGSNILIDSKSGPSPLATTATMQFNPARPDQLIIAMGLGEKNLLDVLQEHQTKGLPGIPLEELLDYVEGAARAIDFLNTARHELGGPQPVAIQHCDIKPQNIMLVGDAVQVCDFGLARSLTDVRSTSVAGSIAYGAPELFWENKPTHATDQYSLAITYYELRTGHLPFSGDMAAIEVMQAHRDGKLDLHHLNHAERAVIKRATTPAPDGRFEKSIDMVRALRRATQDGAAVVSLESTARPPATGIRSSIVQTGREIVPGYTLLEHLFHPDAQTDVWSANAAGGKPQAIWLYDLTTAGGSIDREALRLIQALTDQPHLAHINGWWLLNRAGADITTSSAPLSTMATSVEEATPTTLVIASELTRTNLSHRVEDCRQARGRGIPVEELLGYMQQLAEGIDALNDASHLLRGSRWVSLIHTDLRPANILVFGQTVKIGNFAWCRTLEGAEAEVSGMPVRASRPTMAPELIAGRVNRRIDQYSLAGSYVQMRTGELLLESALPTSAASGAVLGTSLDFSALSEGEAEVIHRAMHSDPNQRYPSCRKMVAELALAIKKVPVSVLDTVYTSHVAAVMGTGTTVGGGTMVSSGLVDSRNQNTVTLPEARSPQDTKPDVYQTIVHETPAIRRTRWSKPKVALAAGALLAAAIVAGTTGYQLETQVNDLTGRQEYKPALEALKQPSFWRSWRSRPDDLKRSIIEGAIAAAKADAEQNDVAKALQIFNDLDQADALSRQDSQSFIDSVLPAAVKVAEQNADQADYKAGYGICTALAKSFPDNGRVGKLGSDLLNGWQERVRVHLQQENFQEAAQLFEQLADVDDRQVRDLKADVISDGRKAIGQRTNNKDFVAALEVGQRLQSVKAFQGDSGLVEAIGLLVPDAMNAAQEELKQNRAEDAKAIYDQLSQLLRLGDSRLRDLGKEILAHELAAPYASLKENQWEAALVAYKRLADDWTRDDWAKEDITKLRGQVIQSATEKFEGAVKQRDKNQADYICKTLEDSFGKGKDARVDALRAKYEREFLQGMPEPEPDVVAAKLMDEADENISAQVFDLASEELARAAKLIDEKLAERADLRRRLTLSRAYLSLQEKKWDDVARMLGEVSLDDLDATKEAAGRLRYLLLRVLSDARFDGATLAKDVKIDDLSQAVAAMRQARPDWREKGDRLLVGRVKQLSQELGRRAAELAAGGGRDQATLATKVLERLDPEDVADAMPNAQMVVAANQTIDLVADPQSSWDQIRASFDKWRADVGKLPPDTLAKLEKALSHWGRESKEPGALGRAIAEIERLPRPTDELRREFAELLVEQLRREASQNKIDWKDLSDKCRRADSAVTAAAAADLGSFVKACQAECLVEQSVASSAPPPDAAVRAVDELLKSDLPDSDRPYVDYLALHVAQTRRRALADDEATPIADRLSAALHSPPPILTVDFRRQASAAALIGVAKKLAENVGESVPWVPPPLAAETAGRVYRWLDQSLQIEPKLAAFDSKLAFATAAATKTPPDEPALVKLVEELSADPKCQTAWVLLRGAQSVERAQPAEAIRRYSRALAAADGATLVGDTAQTAFNKVIKPALALAEKQVPVFSSDAEAKKAVASLYAAKGRLVRTQYTLLAPGQQPDKEAFAAFDLALRYDPERADYYVQRGFARWSMSGGNPDLATLEREDIDPLFDGKHGAAPPGAYGLRGQAKILAARQASDSDRLDLYRKSIADFDEAIRGAQSHADEHFSEFLDGLGTANVEMASYSDEGRDARRAYLSRALQLAEQSKAIEYRPHPEHAWINQGNAEEDFAWLLRDTEGNHYCTAVDAFERAAAEANAALSSPALSMLSQGRCRFKLLASGGSCGQPFADELKAALGNLDQALHAGDAEPAKALPDRLRGQACYWQAQLHSLAASKEPAKKKERYQQADAALDQAIAISGKQGVAEYYLSSIALAMNSQDAAKAIDRAKKFVEADLPAVSLDSKVIAIENVAEMHKRRNDVKSAVQVFTQYLDDPRFKDPTTARCDLLYDRAFFIASVAGRFWTENKKLCDDSANDAVQLAQQLEDHAREAKAWRVRAENAKLSYTSGAPSMAERKTYAEYLRHSIDCIPGKDDMKDTWGWRVDLARVDYEIANAAVKASASGDTAAKAAAFSDAAWFSNEAVKTLQGVDSFAKTNPQLIASITQIRTVMGEMSQKYKQYMPADRNKPAQR